MYKLATTLGILGEHEAAFAMFRRLIQREERPEASLYHYAAVAGLSTQNPLNAPASIGASPGSWQQDSKYRFLPQSIGAMGKRSPEQVPPLSYHYLLPFEEQLMQLDRERIPSGANPGKSADTLLLFLGVESRGQRD